MINIYKVKIQDKNQIVIKTKIFNVKRNFDIIVQWFTLGYVWV